MEPIIWLLSFSAILSNGETVGSIISHYNAPETCQVYAQPERERVAKYLKEHYKGDVLELKMHCTPHRIEE